MISGAILTALGGVGVGVLVGQGVEFSQRHSDYAAGPAHDERLYLRAKTLERWMIGTGVVTCAALASGVALLAIARYRRHIELHPTFGGISVRGRF